jgi:carbonic anhydrase/acetyltransferase-like protein (isoleucine patch superfamily)
MTANTASRGLVLDYLRFSPSIGEGLRVDDYAALIGRTTIGPRATLCEYATVRADGEAIRIGADAWFGPHATAHIADQIRGSVIGDAPTIGRYGVAHACTLGDGVVIGECSVVMDDASVGSYSVIAADSIVPPRKELAGGYLYAGHPAKPVRAISQSEAKAFADALRNGEPPSELTSRRVPDWAKLVGELADRSAGAIVAHGRASRGANAFIAPTAIVKGDVDLGDDASIFFGCAVFAGDARIEIGARTNVQDNCVFATDRLRGDLLLGVGVTIGHNVELGSGTIEDDALVGMGSRVGDNVVVENGGCIGAGAWVEPNTRVRAGWIWAGRPARPFRALKWEERAEFARARDIYIAYSSDYRRKTESR